MEPRASRLARRVGSVGGRGVSKRGKLRAELEAVVRDPDETARFLTARSGLPGPRANLEIAATFADMVGEGSLGPDWFQTLLVWSRIPAVEAPTQHPREFLPFCAVQALAAVQGDASDEVRAETESALRRAANDPRWRMREACAFGLQRIGHSCPTLMKSLVERWMQAGSLLELRASLVALADPPLLEDREMVNFALGLADEVMEHVLALDEEGLRSEAGKAVVKALGFAPSVFVVAAPSEGFALLEAWADRGSIVAAKVVAANLRKARLARRFPDEVQDVGLRLQAAVFD